MFALVKRDFMAMSKWIYLAFLLVPIGLVASGFHILFTSVIVTVFFWVTIYGLERYRKVERYVVSLPVSRDLLIGARYLATFSLLFLMLAYSYLLVIGMGQTRPSIVLPDAGTLYMMVCLAVILVALILPNSFIFASYQMPVFVLSVQFFAFLFLSGELFVKYSLSENISYDTSDEATIFLYERGPWVAELKGMVGYYLPVYPYLSLTLLTLLFLGGSFWLSSWAYKRMNIG